MPPLAEADRRQHVGGAAWIVAAEQQERHAHVLLQRQATKQFVQPDDVGAMAAFLCSDAAAQITGSNISMDGGWTAE
jgi:NAD(P)-dependent dehydrogenase (short-subunit alcohol dehydrogenase family)